MARPTEESIRTGNRKPSVASLMLALLAACTAFQLNASMLSPALVTMAEELKTDEVSVSMAQTAFFTSAAVFGLFVPRLSDMVGRRKVLLAMLIVMSAGAVIAAVAPNITVLVLARVLQGVTGAVVPTCLLVLRSEVTDGRRYGTLMGVVAAVNGGVAGVDAILGGFLATAYGFRSVFWTIAAVGAVAVVICLRSLPESCPSRGARMDWFGALFLAATVFFCQVAVNAMSAGTEANWVLISALLAGGAVAAVVFWRIEHKVAEPLAAPDLFRRREIWATVLTTALVLTGVFATVNGVVMSIAQDGANGFGLDASIASLALLTPYALLGWACAPFAGKLAPLWGYRTVLRIGIGGSVAGIVVLALAGTHSLPVLIAATVFLGLTYAGIANIVLNGLGVVLSPAERPGFLPGLNAAGFGIGAGMSFAILPAIQAAAADPRTGYMLAMLSGAAIMLLALGTSMLIPRPAAAETA